METPKDIQEGFMIEEYHNTKPIAIIIGIALLGLFTLGCVCYATATIILNVINLVTK